MMLLRERLADRKEARGPLRFYPLAVRASPRCRRAEPLLRAGACEFFGPVKAGCYVFSTDRATWMTANLAKWKSESVNKDSPRTVAPDAESPKCSDSVPTRIVVR